MNGRLRYVTDVETVNGKAKLLVVNAIHPQTRRCEFHQIIAAQIAPKDSSSAVEHYVFRCVFDVLFHCLCCP